jgi:hypothetical protein
MDDLKFNFNARHGLGLGRVSVYEFVAEPIETKSLIKVIKQHIEPVTCNVNAERTGWFLHQQDAQICELSLHVSDLCEAVTQIEFNFAAKYRVTECWGAVYKQGHYSEEHDHFPNQYTVIMYLQAEENCSPLIIENEKLVLHPKNKTVYVFPGIVRHSVPKSKSDVDRVVLVFNLVLKNERPI